VVTQDGAAYKEVPLIITKVYDDKLGLVKNQQEAKAVQSQLSDRSLAEKVEKLFNQGMQIDDIAAELSCSTSEVQFIIDML
jgi:DNA-binding NarL/FixJ family response regulator